MQRLARQEFEHWTTPLWGVRAETHIACGRLCETSRLFCIDFHFCQMVDAICEQKKRIIVINMNNKMHQQTRFTLHELAIFVAIARLGTTRAAADYIARSQAAVSAALAALEASLGVELFDRQGRGLVLNENGHTLLPKAASLLDQANQLQRLLSVDNAMPLRVAASLTIGEYLLPKLLVHWQAANLNSPVQLTVGNTNAVIDAMVSFDADIGFIEGPQTHPDLIVQPWLSDRMVIVAAPAHALAGLSVNRRQLADATWAIRETGSGTRAIADHWLLDRVGQINVAFELGSTEAIKQLVASGSCIACMSIYALDQALKQGWLVEVKTQLKLPVRRLAIVLHRDKRLSKGAAEFLRQCQAGLR